MIRLISVVLLIGHWSASAFAETWVAFRFAFSARLASRTLRTLAARNDCPKTTGLFEPMRATMAL